MIKDLVGKGLDLSQDENAAAARYVRKNWIFPLFTLDFDKLKVKPADLQAERTRRQAKEKEREATSLPDES